jgi:3-isopropylmalate/(R)-2-methylmalate dehydratase small subunit
VTGAAIPLDRVDVDTDQIIPKQFLKRVERSGYGDFLFFDWRFLPDGSQNPTFELNRPEYVGAPILLAGRNFGCGSSREHAAWALGDFGIRAVLAPSFADIFLNNCFQNGLLPIVLPEPVLKELMAKAQARPGYRLTVDLERRTVSDESGWSASFEVDAFRRDCLLRGLDEVDLTLTYLDEIRAFEEARTPV